MSEPHRGAQTEQAIADARSPACDAAREIDEMLENACIYARSPQSTPGLDLAPHTVLTGESHEAFVEFTAAAQALEHHQREATPILERYKTALGKLSAIAARSGG